MNTESLHVDQNPHTHEWFITYRGWAETPVHPNYPETVGAAEILASEIVEGEIPSLAAAVKYAREWAEGSGFKIGPPKFPYSNTVEFKLRRPA